MARVWITDLWYRDDADNPKRKIPTARHKKGSQWKVEWYEPQPDGTQMRRSRSFRKKSDAEGFKAKTEHSLREGSYQSADDAARTVGDAIEAWMVSKKAPKASSIGTYRDRIDNYVMPRWQHVRLSAVTRPEIDRWTLALLEGVAPHRTGMRGAGTPLSPATVKNVFMPLNAALGYATEEGWLRRNPASGSRHRAPCPSRSCT